MIRLKNMPHMLWIAGLALIAACSDGGGEERPGPQQTALSIVWTPEAPAAGQSVRFSLGGDVSNVRSVLWMFGDGKTSSAAAGGEVDHAYAAAGDYTVKAAVTPVAGSMSELSRSISVSDTEAAMVVSNDFPACREEVVFSLNRMTGVTGVSWDFGDGSERRQTASASETLMLSSPRRPLHGSGGGRLCRRRYRNADAPDRGGGTFAELGVPQFRSLEDVDHGPSRQHEERLRTAAQLDGGVPPLCGTGMREFIETDVQITKDGEVICLHDNYLSRFTDYNDYASGKGLVADFTLEELGRFRLKTTDGKVSDQKIPTLEEVLMEFRGKVWFNLDKCMESDVSIEKVYDVVERCGCLDRVQFYISDDTDRADWLSRQKPQGIIAPHANKEEVLTRMAAYSPVYMIQTSTQYAGASWISSINARALSVTNLLDDEGQAFYNGNTTVMDGFVSAGVRMIQCDYPAEMDEYLRGRGKR